MTTEKKTKRKENLNVFLIPLIASKIRNDLKVKRIIVSN
jgi:hypothetical protein